jgi:ribose transport system ATP-binding protein
MRVLAIEHLSKHFDGVQALKDVDLEVDGGEVHALLGQNGSGKSTLIKCLSGFHAPDPGWSIEINGVKMTRPVRTGEFRSLGVSFVHQDLGVVPALSVAENLGVGRLATTSRLFMTQRQQRREAADLLREFAVDVDPAQPVEELKPVERAMLAIVRALDELRRWHRGSSGTTGTGLLVLDEATASLGPSGKREVLELVQRVVLADGAAVLFVTHDLNEALAAADRISVLRDGSRVATVEKHSTTLERVVEILTGLEYGALANLKHVAASDDAVDTKGVVIRDLRGEYVDSFSATARGGEIVGLTGLVGAGWDEVPALLYGAVPADSGTLTIAGDTRELARLTPAAAIEAGIAFVPADRLNQATVPDLTIRDNAALPALGQYQRHGLLNLRRLSRKILDLLVRYQVRPPRPALPLSALSGGNQQKVVLAKWLNLQLRLLLLLEPTQGVDIGARAEIFQLIREAADTGTVVLYATADFAEAARVADRVIVLADGRVVAELAGEDITEERIALAAFQGRQIDPSHPMVGGTET